LALDLCHTLSFSSQSKSHFISFQLSVNHITWKLFIFQVLTIHVFTNIHFNHTENKSIDPDIAKLSFTIKFLYIKILFNKSIFTESATVKNNQKNIHSM
jgi:hypothetical protein